MVRAGRVSHPSLWPHSGYQEIQQPPLRKAIIDPHQLMKLCRCTSVSALQLAHRQWIETALSKTSKQRETLWSESVAVGSKAYVENIHAQLNSRAKGRSCLPYGVGYQLKEPEEIYHLHSSSKKHPLRFNNTFFWEYNY